MCDWKDLDGKRMTMTGLLSKLEGSVWEKRIAGTGRDLKRLEGPEWDKKQR